MRLSRFFVDMPLAVGQTLTLPTETAHYATNVLRLGVGATVTLFNGYGGEYLARLTICHKKTVQLSIEAFCDREGELKLMLVSAISRPEHFDYTLQKAVELGVVRIVPVITERSPPLDLAKIPKREQHWRKIVTSACEQCGRNRLPELLSSMPLSEWLSKPQADTTRILLSPQGQNGLNSISVNNQSLIVLIGAEGGFSAVEIRNALDVGYIAVSLGPRILRTETAALAVLAICQAMWGDLDSE
ncbi:MAG: 16S rRNA (uracil(1498)-N(3))-methyltransferase [Beggiatoa sp. IS2]|nr:MAG: 16S rRNA (uracil(1498)-N(3))-methyltransferase [Beggiatoa sp. IS2]